MLLILAQIFIEFEVEECVALLPVSHNQSAKSFHAFSKSIIVYPKDLSDMSHSKWFACYQQYAKNRPDDLAPLYRLPFQASHRQRKQMLRVIGNLFDEGFRSHRSLFC